MGIYTKTKCLILCILIICLAMVQAEKRDIDFSSENWQIFSGKVVEHLGRKAFMGSALLKGIEFEDGIIGVDVAVDGRRSYPGIIFRMKSPFNRERLYIRPHRAGLYEDALQYVPTINGIDGWQLYTGTGYTAPLSIPEGEWVHVRLEVRGDRGQVFIGDSDKPNLEIFHLEHGVSMGKIGLLGPEDGSAYFSNFSYTLQEPEDFPQLPYIVTPSNILTDWEISQPLDYYGHCPLDTYPSEEIFKKINWKSVKSGPSGRVDVAKQVTAQIRPYLIYAKTNVMADQDGIKPFNLGYSDVVFVYCNGQPIFSGNSEYSGRDSGFLGAVGLFDTVYLPLKKGNNEIFLVLADVLGGWGFILQRADQEMINSSLEKVWESPSLFAIPETACYDRIHDCVYISNYDGYRPSRGQKLQSISRLDLSQKKVDSHWLKGLNNPMGMAVDGETLWIVELNALVQVKTSDTEQIVRHIYEKALGLNDIAIDEHGNIFVSDFRANQIFHVSQDRGSLQEWLNSGQVIRPNGIETVKGHLIVGCNGDSSVKSIDLKTKKIKQIARFSEGLIDGIEADEKGHIWISHNQGRLYRITEDGVITKMLDSTNKGIPIANFLIIPRKNLIVIPTFIDNRILIYRLLQ
jgi:hypothetical protein